METSTTIRPDLRRYSIAGIAVILAMAAALLLRPWAGQSVPPIVLAPWILIGAWYGGVAGRLFINALTSIPPPHFFLPPIPLFRILAPCHPNIYSPLRPPRLPIP